MWWSLTSTYIFKVIPPWLWKSCPLCNVFSSKSIISIFATNNHYLLVFGLGRIFRLEGSVFFMAVFRARLELGAINFHLRPCMFTWAKKGSPFEATILALYWKVKSIQLSFDIYRVSNHLLVHDIHQIIGGLHNLFKFQWAITSCLSYVEYWREHQEHQDMPAALWWLMWHSNTLHPPSESCSSSVSVMIMSHCSEGGFR